ncbi:MAG: DUF721 domain-containing protein [Myxococcales bacterium]|nr:DUF721 domain-containing protein [Myxococcales bacterium]MCB9752610.1 DUF721 domain-containing protein [Myxococcales bacterium]
MADSGAMRRPWRHTRRDKGRELARRGPVSVSSPTWSLINRIVPPHVVQMLRIRDAWPRVARGRLRDYTWPAKVDGTTLIVNVHDNQWLHEMQYLRQALTERLIAVCPRAGVDAILPRLAPRQPEREATPEPAPPPAEPAPVAVLSEEPDHDTLRALEAVHDPQLKHLLARVRVMLGRTPERNRGQE